MSDKTRKLNIQTPGESLAPEPIHTPEVYVIDPVPPIMPAEIDVANLTNAVMTSEGWLCPEPKPALK